MKRAPRESLDRTLRLMRDELRDGIGDGVLLQALTQTEVALCADRENLAGHAAQCAFVTAALLMARTGQRVYLLAPDVTLQGAQPPLQGRTLISALLEVGRDLLPGVEFTMQLPRYPVDLAVRLGDSRPTPVARRTISINATAWSAILASNTTASPWRESHWPMGAMGAGALAAGEAFKISMRRLARFARNSGAFDELFAFSENVRVELAHEGAPQPTDLGQFDAVSGGAIIQAALYCLGRIPSVTGSARILEYTGSDDSNLNRYMLLLRSQVGEPKLESLLRTEVGGLRLTGCPVRYDADSLRRVGTLALAVLVGVDHVPTRWFVQSQHDGWLGIGATTHWNAMASFHDPQSACAMCLHPHDDAQDTLIPTVAFVSFWSGLFLACDFVRRAGGESLNWPTRQTFITPLRPESVWRAPVAFRRGCPLCRDREFARGATLLQAG
jgi:hypothetical protein